MVSVISENRQLQNGDCSLTIAPPKYKRRKVYAVRDFPPGCGRNIAPINSDAKEVENGGQMMGETSKDAEPSGPKEVGLCDAEGKGVLEGVVQSQYHDIPDCSRSPKATSSFEKSKKIIENGLPKENPTFSQDLQKMEEEESALRDEIHDPSKDKTKVMVESPGATGNNSVLDLQEAATDIKSKVLVEGTNLEMSSPPHYPIPSTVLWKERKFPPQRRVSALRDFPPGCGRDMQPQSEVEVKQLGLDITDASAHREVVQNDENQPGDSDAVNASRDNVKVVSEKREDEIECQCEAVKGTSPKVNMHASRIGECLETEGQEETYEVKSAEQNIRLIEKEECDGKDVRDVEYSEDAVDKELIVYVKDKNKKRSSIAVSHDDNESLLESAAGLEMAENVVVVQGLMAVSNHPWTKAKHAVKSRPSVISVKRSKGKKHDYARRDKLKGSPNDGTESMGNLGESSKMIVPYLRETEMKEVSHVLRDEGDSTENEESLDDFQLVPRKREFDVTLPPFGAGSSDEKGARIKVRETLRLFHAIVRKLQQGEQSSSKSKDQENASKRIDLRASSILKAHGKVVNTSKKSIVGPVPGVEVGDIFNFRIELSFIGLHRPPQAGIDYVKQVDQIIATSIVASGGYANDVDSSDVLVYTGQGGNARGGDKGPEDQKLERGNLALKNSKDVKNFVRVIRGFKETKSLETADGKCKISATYTYDGLYTVEKYWHDIGTHGKLVYKFELRRVPGQPELAWKEMKQSNKFKVREGRCVLDISEGKETFAISAINTIDDEKPPPFTYITSMMYPDWCQPLPPKGCYCKDGCSDSGHCACAIKNGGEIPYNYNGAIVEAKPLVYECGPSCKCPPTCHNRVSQYGIKFPLEIFKTEARGWGVRSLSSIPSGSFICEYIGELLDDKEAEQRTGNDEYLFDIGQNYNDPTLWDGLSDMMPDLASSSSDVVQNVGFTIDAAKYGNIGRFINHSCSPNLYAQNVLYDHEDKRIPHIMLFAAENIPPLQELTYHYNYTIDEVFDHEGNIKKKSCLCGSSECTGRMY